MKFYNTNRQTCECGETKLLSRMYRVEIPCTHILSLVPFIKSLPPELTLKLTKNMNELDFTFDEVEIHKGAHIDSDEILRRKATKIVRRFSHFKNEGAIREELAEITTNDDFANGLPISFHVAVDNGIRKFSAMHKTGKISASLD